MKKDSCGEALPGTYEEVLSLLQNEEKGKVLDAPAGIGLFSEMLLKEGFEVFAGDIYPEKFKVREIDCQKIDLNNCLPYKNNFFDSIVCIEGIEHLRNPHHLLSEFHRILKNDGKLIITTPNILNLRSRIKFLLSGTFFWFDREAITHWGHINPLPYFELEYLMEKYHFSIEKVTTNRINKLQKLLGMVIRLLCQSLKWKFPKLNEMNKSILLSGQVIIVEGRKC